MQPAGTTATLQQVRVLHGAFTVTPLIYLGILMALPRNFPHPFSSDSPPLLMITIALGVIGLADLVVAQFLPRLIARAGRKRNQSPERTARTTLVSRPSFFAAIPIYGLILALLGAHWMVFLRNALLLRPVSSADEAGPRVGGHESCKRRHVELDRFERRLDAGTKVLSVVRRVGVHDHDV